MEAIKDDKNIKALTAIAVSPEILKSLSALPEPPKGLKNLFTVGNIKTVLRNQFKKIKDNEEDKYLFELDKKIKTSRKDRPGKLEYSMKSPENFFNNLEDDPENAKDTLKNRIDKINSIQKLARGKNVGKKDTDKLIETGNALKRVYENAYDYFNIWAKIQGITTQEEIEREERKSKADMKKPRKG